MSLAKMLKTIGVDKVEADVWANHLVETKLSITRRNELKNQLSSPKAGVRAHLESCQRCRRDVERKFEEMVIRTSGGDSSFATAPATA